MPAIIFDFKAIGGALRKQRIDDWWQPAKPEPEPKAAEPITSDDWCDPFRFNLKDGHHEQRSGTRSRLCAPTGRCRTGAATRRR